ncbi:flagellar biosynthetic protein FliQ [Luteimonas wenzhouensis]|jgi:flagellar biosynthetic protein FliQ|uniref:Flagellar biosynthetic protein FliQ n=1 Tax=Luteimonas wenzhouensis TaxID=2599615 RepID=A0A5C5TWT3_9GAMM|nr:flagellar biosynthetic protein FliQ [Luteimonas wenzhouensis]NLW96740.1 flagellar biosynthetic protein FliQ [Xanthomonadaceae bacterium]TWT18019.1 flagellar biosynthetic protein FliQ [Luteimonas wenzhouensis]
MTPETALGEISRGLQMALTLGGPALIAVLVVGVAVGVMQAATQVNEPTIQFVVKALGLVVVLATTGHFLLGRLVAFTIDLFHRIPHLIG